MDDKVEELILQMSWRDTEDELIQAKRALDDFIGSSEQYVKSLCFSKSNGDDLVFRDLYRLLILDVWEKCHLYDDRRNPDDSPQIKVKKWLGYRMRSVLSTYWGSRSTSKFGVVGIEAFEDSIQETGFFDAVELNIDKLELALEKGVLKKVEIDILTTHYEFRGYVPTEISEALCKEYQITESYRRVIKCRALKRLKEFSCKKTLALK